ncbi:hypothetical protein AB6O49_16435 [Streptomyces sp. SBR177]
MVRSTKKLEITILSTSENEEIIMPEWQQKLEASGLEVLDREVPASLPEAMSAIYAATGIDVKPTVSVRNSLPDADVQLNQHWAAQTAAHNLTSENDAFYILTRMTGGGERAIDWIHVRDTIGSDLPYRIRAGTGNAEFLVVSEDGRVMCAVTTEESESWIVVHRFS